MAVEEIKRSIKKISTTLRSQLYLERSPPHKFKKLIEKVDDLIEEYRYTEAINELICAALHAYDAGILYDDPVFREMKRRCEELYRLRPRKVERLLGPNLAYKSVLEGIKVTGDLIIGNL